MAPIIAWLGRGRIVGFALLAGLLLLRVLDPLPVQALRAAVFDIYQQTQPRDPGRLPVAIIDIDDPSLEELGQWPWPRDRIAKIVETAARQGAVALAFDIVFSEPDRMSPGRILSTIPNVPDEIKDLVVDAPDTDRMLAEAMANLRVVVGQTSVRSARSTLSTEIDTREVPHAFLGPSPVPYLLKFPDVVQNLPLLEDAASGRGVFSIQPDPDGIYRRVPLVMMVDGRIRLGLSLELLRVATGGDAFAVRSNEAGIDGIILAGQAIRTDAHGRVWPYFSHTDPSRFIRASDLLQGRVPDGRLAGHLVLLGTSAIGLEDYRPTPLGVPMAGVEIHAQVLENILSNSLLRRPNYAIGAELVVVALLGSAIIVLVPILGAVWVFALSLSLLAGYLAFSYSLFLTRLSLLDSSFPVLAILLTMMLMASANYLREERQRRQIRSAFGQYVSPDLVERLSSRSGGLKLGGENRELTVLFTDVRGFTGIAESYRNAPERLTELMNKLLTVQSQAVLDAGGTIDKFMGDAVMAFWNAPLDCDDHAPAAADAALRMLDGIAALNAEVEQTLNIGIGLNTGICTVGNMGSAMRFDYTALGDTVNIASRLEGQSKTYGVPVLLGEATAAALDDSYALIELDRLRVKGKQLPETVYALLGGAALANSDAFAEVTVTNDKMLSAYRAGDLDIAEAALNELANAAAAASLSLETYAALYRERISVMYETSPPPDWDGAHDAASK